MSSYNDVENVKIPNIVKLFKNIVYMTVIYRQSKRIESKKAKCFNRVLFKAQHPK